jgi:hypothetical protein
MKKTLITSDQPQNGSTLSTTTVCGLLLDSCPAELTCLSPEHYFDREAESNDPSFLTHSLDALWNPLAHEGVVIV